MQYYDFHLDIEMIYGIKAISAGFPFSNKNQGDVPRRCTRNNLELITDKLNMDRKYDEITHIVNTILFDFGFWILDCEFWTNVFFVDRLCALMREHKSKAHGYDIQWLAERLMKFMS